VDDVTGGLVKTLEFERASEEDSESEGERQGPLPVEASNSAPTQTLSVSS